MNREEFKRLVDKIAPDFLHAMEERQSSYKKLVEEGNISIETVFNWEYEKYGIKLPEGAVEKMQKGKIKENPWNIYFVFGEDNKGKYIQYYATNRFTNDGHMRIYENGETVELPAYWDMIFYGGNTTFEEAEKKNMEHNEIVLEMLKKDGIKALMDEDCQEFLESLRELDNPA